MGAKRGHLSGAAGPAWQPGCRHLGLALALERLQQAEQARLHYQRALQDSALEPATRDYIAARLRALGGQ